MNLELLNDNSSSESQPDLQPGTKESERLSVPLVVSNSHHTEDAQTHTSINVTSNYQSRNRRHNNRSDSDNGYKPCCYRCCAKLRWLRISCKCPFYGIDAPVWVIKYSLRCVIATGLSIVLWNAHNIGKFILPLAIYWFICTAMFVCTSLCFKIALANYVCNQIQWNGNERILDVGCGTGLMLVTALRKSMAAAAQSESDNECSGVGLDIWDNWNQTGGTPLQVLDNAKIYGIDSKIRLISGDARRTLSDSDTLPDSSFDVVLSSWFLHVFKNEYDRNTLLDGMIRVLKPGGRLIFIDNWNPPFVKRYFIDEYGCECTNSWWMLMFCTPNQIIYCRKPLT